MTFKVFFFWALLFPPSLPSSITLTLLDSCLCLSSSCSCLRPPPLPRAVVHVQVDDVNEFSPAFREPLYKASLTEHKIYDSILQVPVSPLCFCSSEGHVGLKYHPLALVSQSGITPPEGHQRKCCRLPPFITVLARI